MRPLPPPLHRSPETVSSPAATTRVTAARRWLRALWPARMPIDSGERWRVVIGATFGMLVTALVCHRWPQVAGTPWLVAPMGASAVLVFGVPSSPLAHPWAVVGGNTISALVGIACARWIGSPDVAAATAVALAIALMFALRCLHPPGGASALLMVLGGVVDPTFVVFPVLVNSLLLTASGMAYNYATRRPYPPLPNAAKKSDRDPGEATDLDAVLARYNRILDIGRDDLRQLLDQTSQLAYERRLRDTLCADIMSRDVVTVATTTHLQDAWTLLRERHVKALPVIDRSRRVVGILTLADFLKNADLDLHSGFDGRLRQWLRRAAEWRRDRPEVVGEIMTRRVRVASVDRHLADLVPLFGGSGHHHIPVIDSDERLVGIITQSDLVAALCAPEAPDASGAQGEAANAAP